MKTKLTAIAAAIIIAAVSSCNKDDDKTIDIEKPDIDISMNDASPANKATFYFGEGIPLKFLLSDNEELGSYSINIHSNFDHHSHSTEEEGEEQHHEESEEHHHENGDDGEAYYFTLDFTIPDSRKEFLVDTKIDLQAQSDDGDKYEGGDYHFMITVTDKAGFSTFKALEIKILYR